MIGRVLKISVLDNVGFKVRLMNEPTNSPEYYRIRPVNHIRKHEKTKKLPGITEFNTLKQNNFPSIYTQIESKKFPKNGDYSALFASTSPTVPVPSVTMKEPKVYTLLTSVPTQIKNLRIFDTTAMSTFQNSILEFERRIEDWNSDDILLNKPKYAVISHSLRKQTKEKIQFLEENPIATLVPQFIDNEKPTPDSVVRSKTTPPSKNRLIVPQNTPQLISESESNNAFVETGASVPATPFGKTPNTATTLRAIIGSTQKRQIIHVKAKKIVRDIKSFEIFKAKFMENCCYGDSQNQRRDIKRGCEVVKSAMWRDVEVLLDFIDEFLEHWNVQYAEINTSNIEFLIRNYYLSEFNDDMILFCFQDRSNISSQLSNPGQAYKSGKNSSHYAAITIQKWFRMCKFRNKYLDHKNRIRAQLIFYKYWKIRKLRQGLRDSANSRFLKIHQIRANRLYNTFLRQWDEIGVSKCIVVHLVPNFSNTECDLNIGRAVYLMDALVELILVVPRINTDQFNYYNTILGISNPDQNPLHQSRLQILTLEDTTKFFPETSKTSKILLSNLKVLKKIRDYCSGKRCFLSLDFVGDDEELVSSLLGIPIFGPTPEGSKNCNSTLSSRKISKNVGLDIVFGLESNSNNYNKFSLHITKSFSLYPQFNRFYLFTGESVVNNNQEKTPDAYIDRNDFQPLLNSINLDTHNQQSHGGRRMSVIGESILSVPQISEKFKLLKTTSFSKFIESWRSSSEHLIEPVIPSSPTVTSFKKVSVLIMVEPNLKFRVYATGEQIFSDDYNKAAIQIPQKSIANDVLLDQLSKISNACVQQIKFYELRPGFSNSALRIATVNIVSGCKIEKQTGNFTFSKNDIPLRLRYLNENKSRFTDMRHVREEFGKKLAETMELNDERFFLYIEKIQHPQTKTGCLWPALDTQEENSIAMICGGSSLSMVYELALISLVRLWRRIHVFGVPEKNNFQELAKRLDKEWKLYLPISEKFSQNKTRSQKNYPRKTSSDLPQNNIGIYPETTRRSSTNSTNTSHKPGIFSHHHKPPHYKHHSLTNETEEDDFEKFMQKLISPYRLEPLSPPSSAVDRILISTIGVESIPEPHMNAESILLLSEGVPSRIIEQLDPSFKNPVLSPPYTRKAKKTGGKIKRDTYRAMEIMQELEKNVDRELEEASKLKANNNHKFFTMPLNEKPPRLTYSGTRKKLDMAAVMDKISKVQKRKMELSLALDKQLLEMEKILEEKKKERLLAMKKREIIKEEEEEVNDEVLELSELESSGITRRRTSTLTPSAGLMRSENMRQNRIITGLVGHLIQLGKANDNEEQQPQGSTYRPKFSAPAQRTFGTARMKSSGSALRSAFSKKK
ncbi:hypothetical protein HK098_000734 [Nowakowskiella sp. JEL0407]|nr:hypothetical protein HK098_000734 [Nowakowskiella sp. JEL0407]